MRPSPRRARHVCRSCAALGLIRASLGGLSLAHGAQARALDPRKTISAVKPRHRFDRLVVSEAVREDILAAVAVLAPTQQVFAEWGLEEIEPFPRTALNFHGPAGVGKTLAAHAVADYLGKRILLTSYADVERKYVGDGPTTSPPSSPRLSVTTPCCSSTRRTRSSASASPT